MGKTVAKKASARRASTKTTVTATPAGMAKIERGVPIMFVRPGKPRRYPWSELKVGESFLSGAIKTPAGLYNSASNTGIRVAICREGRRFRVHRVA